MVRPPAAAVAAAAEKWKLFEYLTILLTPARPALEIRMNAGSVTIVAARSYAAGSM